jgi:hypothetical protein
MHVTLTPGRARTRLRRKVRAAVLATMVGAGAAGVLGVAPASATTPTPVGYWLIGKNGALWSIAGAQSVTQTVNGVTGPLGSPLSAVPTAAIVGVASTPTGKGYWAADAGGGVYTYGDAGFFGALPGMHLKLSQPIVAIVATPTGKGYWLVGGDGGIFTFGDAGYLGSLPALHASVTDIVGMSATSDGGGYWMVGSDGGVFAFGDAGYFGSIYDKTGSASPLPIVGITGSPAGTGYLLARNDGAVFAFGTSFFGGSPLLSGVTGPDMVAIRYTPDGKGYWVAGSDGGVFCYGDAPFLGSVPGELLNTGLTNTTPIVGFAPTL